MNVKLLKLALQANLINYVDHETPRVYFIDGYADVEEVEKFAELIIQECLDFCRHEPNEDPYDSYDIGYDSATQNISKAIKVNFGVEE